MKLPFRIFRFKSYPAPVDLGTPTSVGIGPDCPLFAPEAWTQPAVYVSFPTRPIGVEIVSGDSGGGGGHSATPTAGVMKSDQTLEVTGMVATLARRLAEKSLKIAREGSDHIEAGRLTEGRECSVAAYAYSDAAEQVLIIARNL